MQDSANLLDHAEHYEQNTKDTNYDDYSDYDIYKSNVDSHSNILHDYFKHLNHNYQQGYSNGPGSGQGSTFYPMDRNDQSNSQTGDELFAGDIGDSDIIKRDSNSVLEPAFTQASVSPMDS